MRFRGLWAGILFLVGCGCGGPVAETPKEKPAPPLEPARITQFYAEKGTLQKGEKTLICYGVENASTAQLDPGAQKLSITPARCLEIGPTGTTRYTVTATGADGKAVTQTLTVRVGPAPPPKPHIVNVTVSSLSVHPNDLVSVCYEAEGATEVRIDPIGYHSTMPKGCATNQPQKTTTYVVKAIGTGGQDTEKVTVSVQPR